jgi:hypothetical protein
MKRMNVYFYVIIVPLLLDYIIPESKWSHVDYFLSKDVGFYVNSKVIDILRSSDWSDL